MCITPVGRSQSQLQKPVPVDKPVDKLCITFSDLMVVDSDAQ
jgi:hypothetical protein